MNNHLLKKVLAYSFLIWEKYNNNMLSHVHFSAWDRENIILLFNFTFQLVFTNQRIYF